MDNGSLEALVQRLISLDEERAIVVRQAFSALSVSDRELWKLAVEVLQKEETAARWFAGKIPVLGGRMPFDLLFDGRREEVIDCLYRIKYGMFS